MAQEDGCLLTNPFSGDAMMCEEVTSSWDISRRHQEHTRSCPSKKMLKTYLPTFFLLYSSFTSIRSIYKSNTEDVYHQISHSYTIPNPQLPQTYNTLLVVPWGWKSCRWQRRLSSDETMACRPHRWPPIQPTDHHAILRMFPIRPFK